ncbi:SRPBCC domain-containing protein [Cryptosporangium sp. NPDC051539]|uniref:SRPBCC domain-containing protein n=1 Tax=Cryptosporangium sp. NPDC051539 TaxID=3363962 RepID=UPI0037B2BEED
MDIPSEIKAIHRAVTLRPADAEVPEETVAVLLRREYDAEIEDVWNALTDPERIRRWFLPVSGDLTVGGTFQLEGNAGGEILDCEPPQRLKVTFGGPVEAANSPEAIEFSRESIDAWTEVVDASGTASAEDLAAARAAALAQFVPHTTA